MSGERQVIELLEQQRRETREQFNKLESAMTEMSKATSQLAVSTSRMEERHARQDDAQRRMGKQLDDHETRLRTLEQSVNGGAQGAKVGWKVVTVIFGAIATTVTIAIALVNVLSGVTTP